MLTRKQEQAAAAKEVLAQLRANPHARPGLHMEQLILQQNKSLYIARVLQASKLYIIAHSLVVIAATKLLTRLRACLEHSQAALVEQAARCICKTVILLLVTFVCMMCGRSRSGCRPGLQLINRLPGSWAWPTSGTHMHLQIWGYARSGINIPPVW